MVKRKYRIGLIVDYFVSEYSSLIIEGVRRACKDFDIELLIFSIGQLHTTRGVYEYQNVAVSALVNKNNLDGIIMTSGTQNHYLSKEELNVYVKSFQPLPIVNIAIEIPDVPSITVDPYNAYNSIINELVNNQKCSKFGIMGVRGNSIDVKTRINCIQECLLENSIDEKNIYLWSSTFDYNTTFMELENYYNSTKSFDFDAVFALNDEMAFACIDFLRKIGKHIPNDVVVVGFDDLNRDTYSNPTLTSINQNIQIQGYSAAITLKQQLEGAKVSNCKKIDAKAILRESTRRFPYSSNYENENCITIDFDDKDLLKNNEAASEWYLKRSEFLHFSQFFTEMQTTMSISNLKGRINQDLRSFGIQACAIVLYDSPVEMTTPFDFFSMPNKAVLFSAFDNKTGFDSVNLKQKVKFNPNESIIPNKILTFDSNGMFAASLFHETLQYGYILYQPGNYDVVCYDLLIKMTSTLLSSCYQFTIVHNEQEKFKNKSDKLNIIAKTDELTGLLNRRGFYDFGKKTLRFAQSMKQNGIIVYCDMDNLKKINDTFGHESGDKAIAAEAQILKKNFRSNDVVSRIGGDEFAIISPGLTPEAFNRIKNQINKDCMKWGGNNKSPFDISISMGCIAYPLIDDDYSITSLLSAADSILYEEKQKKKNQ